MHSWALLILGIACAGAGGHIFVRGAAGLARWSRISPGIIGATVGAFATSGPELSVSINSALAGRPQLALGDALGSNVVNVALILGAALAISGIRSPRASLTRDFPVALLAPLVTALLCIDGRLSRTDGLLLLSAFAGWLVATIIEVRQQRSLAASAAAGARAEFAAGQILLGLTVLVIAGWLVVQGASGVAASFGVGEFAIGATVVAVGTSVPELATAVVSKLRGDDEIGLGTILGSNIFNGLFIVALAALIQPIAIAWSHLASALAFGAVALLCAYPPASGLITRGRGALLLAVYALYVAAILQTAAA